MPARLANVAAVPLPSCGAGAPPPPAKVVTSPVGEILRSRPLIGSDTIRPPLLSTTRPIGVSNVADVPWPSAEPVVSEPAHVDTCAAAAEHATATSATSAAALPLPLL